MRPFRTKPKKDNNSELSEEQRHYQNMISYFKWALGFTGSMMVLILTAAGILFFKDRTAFNAEIKTYLRESKEQIKEMASNAQTTLKDTKDESNLLSYSLKSDAEKSIQYIREDAKSLALAEATKQVNDAFREKNIQKTIEEAANKEITSSVKEMVFDKLSSLPKILLALDRIRAGQKESYLYLESIAKNSKDPFYKSFTDSLVRSKRDEYDNSMDEIKCIKYIELFRMMSSGLSIVESFNLWNKELKDKSIVDSTEEHCKKLFNEAITDAQENNNLNQILIDFKVLRFFTGEKIKMFDFDILKTLKYKEGIKHPFTCNQTMYFN